MRHRHRPDVRAHRARDHRELVASEPRHHIARPNRLDQAARKLHEQGVTGCVAQRVVDVLEIIEIDQQRRDALAGFQAAHQQIVKLAREGCPIGDAGERVDLGGPEGELALVGELARSFLDALLQIGRERAERAVGIVELERLGLEQPLGIGTGAALAL